MVEKSGSPGAYAPPPEDYDLFAEAGQGAERRGRLLFFAAAAVVVFMVALVWSAYNAGLRDRSESPRILADASPYREAPADPGGYETPDQDIEAYNLPEDGGPLERIAEATVRPAPEEPIDPLTQTQTGAEPEASASDGAIPVETVPADEIDLAAQAAGPADEDPVDGDPAEAEPAQAEAGSADVDSSNAAPVESPPPEPVEAAEPETVTAAPEAPEAAPAAPEPAPVAAAPQGDWVVQIAAFRSRQEADDGWDAFTRRFEELSTGYTADIEEADLGARGVYHRLRIAAFQSRDAASVYCTTLQGRGQDCLVRRR